MDKTGKVSGYDSVTPVDDGATMVSGGKTYKATYIRGEQTEHNENVRTDTAINSRPGIVLTKVDWNGDPLEGAVFTLKDEQGDDVAADSYTSGEDGQITIAYLDPGVYTIAEIRAPKGYVALEAPVSHTVSEDGDGNTHVAVDGIDARFYEISLENSEMVAEIKLKNRSASLEVVKIDATGEHPLEGAHFALYRQVTIVAGRRPIRRGGEDMVDSRVEFRGL